MQCTVHNVDRLNPALIRATPLVVHYFADTQMAIRHLRFEQGYSRVQITPLAAAFDPNVSVSQLFFDFAETPDEHLAFEFEHIFGRFPRVFECYRSLLALPWVHDSSMDRDAAFRTRRGGVLILRVKKSGETIYSPFKRLDPLSAHPARWSKLDVVRMLHNGQFESILSKLPAAVDERERVDANDLARKMIEDTWLEWSFIAEEGRPVIAVARDTRARARMSINAHVEIMPAFIDSSLPESAGPKPS